MTIKHGANNPVLKNFQLGFSTTDKNLYINKNSSNIKIFKKGTINHEFDNTIPLPIFNAANVVTHPNIKSNNDLMNAMNAGFQSGRIEIYEFAASFDITDTRNFNTKATFLFVATADNIVIGRANNSGCFLAPMSQECIFHFGTCEITGGLLKRYEKPFTMNCKGPGLNGDLSTITSKFVQGFTAAGGTNSLNKLTTNEVTLVNSTYLS